jgi:hypothetical protein
MTSFGEGKTAIIVVASFRTVSETAIGKQHYHPSTTYKIVNIRVLLVSTSNFLVKDRETLRYST